MSETGCRHYYSEKDIVSIKMKCCGNFYPCIYCHDEAEAHPAQPWEANEGNIRAIKCMKCRSLLTISEYLHCNNTCPCCGSLFNPGCRNHYHYYFNSGLLV